MNYDQYGRAVATEDDLVREIYKNPELDLSSFFINDVGIGRRYLNGIKKYYMDGWTSPEEYQPLDITVDEFDQKCQANWYMPNEYKELDIAQWLLDRCDTDAKLQRVAEELLLYQERDLIDLLRMLKYLVDVMQEHKIVWGVGRGSSVASYVLYLIGVHRIDSMYYDLDVHEFLRNK